jgi:hypothetical protein
MFIRRRRAAVTLVSSLLLAGGLMAGIAAAVPAAAGTAVAYPTVTIHLTNASQFCVNVTNNVNRSGQPLQLWTCSGSGDDRFYELPDPGCFEGVCMEFQDVQNTALCISGPQTVGGTVALGACNSGRGTWYSTCYPGHLGNGFWRTAGTSQYPPRSETETVSTPRSVQRQGAARTRIGLVTDATDYASVM